MKKREQLTEEELVDWWLTKFHNTTIKQIEIEHPEIKDSRTFYRTFPVTQEQHDEWEKWAKEHVRKVTGFSKKYIDKAWWSVYLNTSPSIIDDKLKKEINDK